MWSTDRSRALAAASVLGLALAGCASGGPHPQAIAEPLTPTQQFVATAEQVPDQLALRAHPTGLSHTQRGYLAAFVGRWRESGREPIVIRTPQTAPGAPIERQAVDRVAADLVAAFQAAGVPTVDVRFATYDTAGVPDSPVLVSFLRYEARGPDCRAGHGNWTSTGANQPTANFGCAMTANFAAMVADPHDLIAPAPSQPGDATRRATVLQAYRAGEITSSARDDQAVGVVSQAVQ